MDDDWALRIILDALEVAHDNAPPHDDLAMKLLADLRREAKRASHGARPDNDEAPAPAEAETGA